MRISTAMFLFAGIAVGAFIGGLMRYGNFLDISPIGRVVLVTVISAILLAALGLYFHFKKLEGEY